MTLASSVNGFSPSWSTRTSAGEPSPEQLWADLADLHKRIKPGFDPTTEARAAWEEQQAAA